jgi:hypothetical protein
MVLRAAALTPRRRPASAAERKAGALLKGMSESGARDGRGGDRKSLSRGSTLKLDDLGISRDQSSTWQKLAAVPDDLFEAELARKERPTASGIGTRRGQRRDA